MKISNTAPQHLSNYEVLSHFLTLKKDNDHLSEALKLRAARQKAWAKSTYPIERDKDYPEEDPGLLEDIGEEREGELDRAARRGLSEGLNWVTEEVIKYLCSTCTPTSRQTSEGIMTLADQLQDHGLTKAEVLQICNLAPSEPVELYTIIEEVDHRFHPDPQGRLDEIGSQVRATLLDYPPEELEVYTGTSASASAAQAQGQGQGEENEYAAPSYVGAGGGAGAVDAEMEAIAQEMEQEYVFEQDKEGGVDDEQNGEFD